MKKLILIEQLSFFQDILSLFWLILILFHVCQEFVEPAVIDQAGYILIALGAFIFIISFLGYCGSIKESRVLLTAYGIFLIIIFCLEVNTKIFQQAGGVVLCESENNIILYWCFTYSHTDYNIDLILEELLMLTVDSAFTCCCLLDWLIYVADCSGSPLYCV